MTDHNDNKDKKGQIDLVNARLVKKRIDWRDRREEYWILNRTRLYEGGI